MGRSSTMMDSRDPEPPVGTVVRDSLGHEWRRWPEGYWLDEAGDVDSDPESWVKVAGNYGPVTVIR